MQLNRPEEMTSGQTPTLTDNNQTISAKNRNVLHKHVLIIVVVNFDSTTF